MKIINVVQGSEEWHAIRAKHFTASEAPVMMGASRKLRRNELLDMKATGTEREITDWVQRNLFDKGHEQEAAARPIVEEMIGDELYPMTAVDDADWLLASYDGVTMLGDTNFEHKMWNPELAEHVRNRDLPPEYYWQLEQQHLVNGAERTIFVCSDGTPDRFEWMEYRPVEGRAKQLIAGWKQFEEDLANYKPVEDKPEAVGQAPMELPALIVELTGEVKNSNLVTYKGAVLARIQAIKTDLQTDEDFADADKTVKFLGEAEKRVELVKQQALAQTSSIDDLFRTVDELRETMRSKRLELDKLVKARKESIRVEIRQTAVDAFRKHVDTINAHLGKVRLPDVQADFASVMKGKRTIASLRDAVDTELARVKIEANEWSETIENNLGALRTYGGKHPFLFSDAQQLVLKSNEDLVDLVQARVIAHEAAEKQRLDDERERIRAEEQRKAEAAQEAKAAEPPPAPAVTQAAAEAPSPEATPQSAPPERRASAAPAPAPAPATIASRRPTDAEIITALADRFFASESAVIVWLREMDLRSAELAIAS